MQVTQPIKVLKPTQNTPPQPPKPKGSKTKTPSKQRSLLSPASASFFEPHENDQFIACSLREIIGPSQNIMFGLYYQFLSSLTDNQPFLNTLFSELQFEESGVVNKAGKLSIKSFIHEKSFNGQQITSLEDFNNLMKKRISIEVIQSNLSLESIGSIHYDSETTFESDHLTLTKEFVQLIFQNPSPFIMTQSLCLLLKYLWRTKGSLTKHNCAKLVLISTMLAFKLCYDQQVEGIGWYYASIITLQSKQIPRLQAKFVRELDFQTDITKNQYFTVSAHLLAKDKPL